METQVGCLYSTDRIFPTRKADSSLVLKDLRNRKTLLMFTEHSSPPPPPPLSRKKYKSMIQINNESTALRGPT